jgi:isopenicillin N synthase-like dioxygenase
LEPDAQLGQKKCFTEMVDRLRQRFMQGQNLWPAGLLEFRKVTEEYYGEMQQLPKVMFRLLSLALELEEGYFDSYAVGLDGELLRN